MTNSYLITGGTGSFGQAFIRLLLSDPTASRVVIYSRDELKQFEMSKEFKDDRLRFFIGDIRDRSRLQRAFNGIDVVINAAALKQVPAAEYNPDECIKTNILGTQNIIDAALDIGIPKVIGLSTDKAVHPISLYGATKLCSERLLVAANNLSGQKGPKFSVIRYGNFLGSRGSIIPLFKEMASLGTIPITDKRMTRFWVTLEDAANFAYACIKVMRGGEIFVPKLKSSKVIDIANEIAPNCKHEIIGMRQGEKLHETLIGEEEFETVRDIGPYFVIDQVIGRWRNEGIALSSDQCMSSKIGESHGQEVDSRNAHEEGRTS